VPKTFIVALAFGLPVFGILSLIGWCSLGDYHHWFFDPLAERGKFEPHAKRYQTIATLIVTLSAASVAFLANFLVNIPADKQLRSPYSLKLEAVAPQAMSFFASASYLRSFL